VSDPVELLLPGALADVAGGQRRLLVAPPPESVAALLDAVARTHPALERRVRDETGALRRYVNVYVDGEDVRALDGIATALRPGSQVHVLPSVAGG
jgi:molybdopterin converting factor small subunit